MKSKVTIPFSCALVLILFGLLACQSVGVRYSEGVSALPASAVPPELTELLQALPRESGAEADAVVRRWESWVSQRGGLPIVKGREVTFVFYAFEEDSRVERVCLSAPFNGFSDRDELYRHGRSKLFYKTYSLPQIQPTEYVFLVFDRDVARNELDPFNPSMTAGRPRRSLMGIDTERQGTITFFRGPNPPEGFLLRAREITVYTPPGYASRPNQRYPVFYLHDGQNIWDAPTLPFGGWKANTIADQLILDKEIEPLIIVGIANSSRRAEEYVGGSVFYKMTPTLDEDFVTQARRLHDEYRRYVVEVVKPFIDQRYRTLPDEENTAIGGASFGAGVSLSIAFAYPGVFSRVAALSGGNYGPNDPQWNSRPYVMYPWLMETLITAKRPLKIWLDCGTENIDAIFLPRSREMRNHLVRLGWREGVDLRWVEDVGAGHNEREWAKRLPEILRFFFPKR